MKEIRKTMKKSAPLTDEEGEVRELTVEDFKLFRPIREVASPEHLKKLGIRGPQKAPTKIVTTIRLSRDVIEIFKATGNGWQSRIDSALRQFIAEHPNVSRQDI
jgi:uncharacterized protein (DUF4415 family)